MSKPRGVEWIERETGQELVRAAVSGEVGRHLSLRVSSDLFVGLEELAVERGETVSQLARRLLTEGLAQHANPDRDGIDAAIATLERVRRGLDSSDASLRSRR